MENRSKVALSDSLRIKKNRATYLDSATNWLKKNWDIVNDLYENHRLRDFVFEPFKGVFRTSGKDIDGRIGGAITQVALINMVLAGLPGKMGVGVAVSLAFEIWMGYVIAKEMGLIEELSDIVKYFGVLSGSLVFVLFAFRHLIGFGFSLFSWIPLINPLIIAELFATNLVGLLFWQGFEFAKSTGEFRIPKKLLLSSWRKAISLSKHQLGVLKGTLSPTNFLWVGRRLKAWVSGSIIKDKKRARGDILEATCIAYILTGKNESFNGPIGQEFINSIRDRIPALETASIEEISDYFQGANQEEIRGYISLIKGKLFERLSANQENTDGDEFKAELHADESHPGSDMILTNEETGVTLELSLKATDNSQYIEDALSKYPDIPILATEEAASQFEDNANVFGNKMTNSDLEDITSENLNNLLKNFPEIGIDAAVGSVSGRAIGVLWPITVAYLRKKISGKELQLAYKHLLGESGISLAVRVSYAAVLGPVFAWFLLARSISLITKGINPQANAES